MLMWALSLLMIIDSGASRLCKNSRPYNMVLPEDVSRSSGCPCVLGAQLYPHQWYVCEMMVVNSHEKFRYLLKLVYISQTVKATLAVWKNEKDESVFVCNSYREVVNAGIKLIVAEDFQNLPSLRSL